MSIGRLQDCLPTPAPEFTMLPRPCLMEERPPITLAKTEWKWSEGEARMSIRVGRLAAALLLILASSFPAVAWPDRPVRIVVGFQAGGSSDVVARLLAERLRLQFEGANFIVDNKPGASGAIAAEAVLNSHDAHTFLVFSDSYVTASLTNKAVRFRPQRDFRMISAMCEGPLVVLGTPGSPFRTFGEWVDYARANPGKLNYATAGVGGQQHLTAEYIAATLKLDMVHIPLRGGGPAVNDLLSGQVESGVLGLGPTLPHLRSGRLRALAVSTASRVPQLPDVPTLIEAGLPGFSTAQWFGLAAPHDTPDAVVDGLAQAMARALDDEAIRRRFDEIGFAVQTSTPAALTAKVSTEEARWKELIEERGLRFD
jgi:tripartite-type tricarboxylate transporter receptor subunit TctC